MLGLRVTGDDCFYCLSGAHEGGGNVINGAVTSQLVSRLFFCFVAIN